MTGTPRPVLLIDTFSLFFRSFYALPPMNTAAGQPTSALYGFSTVLLKLLREQPGAELAFALDAPAATFRHVTYEAYKAGRAPAPDALRSQLEHLAALLAAFGAPTFRVPGFEADDLLATLARRLRTEEHATFVVSGDRDLLQLAHGSVRVYFVGRRAKDAVIYDERAVIERFGVPPERLPSYVALIGDTSDNLPGVPGIGPSTAAKLLSDRTDCKDLLSHLESVSPARVREALLTHRDQILSTENLARLRDDVALPEGPRSAAPTPESVLTLRKIFEELEFRSLRARLDALFPS
jgi:DNA polymerase-1